MTRFLTRSLSLVGALALGCGPTSPQTVVGSGVAGTGSVDISGGAGMCGGGFGPGGVAPGGFATGAGGGNGSPTTPQVGVTHTATSAPPAISGGTLRILADGKTAVAADPDRDQVYVVDLTARAVTFTVPLQPGDEPGRLAIDAAGRAHVALRRGGALVTIDTKTGGVVARRAVCAAPRGVAYDAANDLLHVACADGQLVSLPAAGGPATRTLQLDSDLRDVMVDGNTLHITRFRSAELLTIDATGKVTNRLTPPPFRSVNTRGGELYTASVAWRSMEMPTGGVVMLHQRGLMDDVQPTAGGYGGFNTCDAIVQTAITTVVPGQDPKTGPVTKTGPAMAGLVVPADMALSADGNRVAIIAAGNATNSETEGGPPRLPRVFVTDMNSATDQVIGCTNDGQHGPCLPQGGVGFGVPSPPVLPPTADMGAAGDSGTGSGTGTAGTSGTSDTGGAAGASVVPTVPNTCNSGTDSGSSSDPSVPEVVGQPIAVAFAANSQVVVQSREPAVLSFPGGAPIQLSTISRSDTGHDLFHANAGGGIACASCHAEGTEDGRTWTFACEGTRRTQSLQVGLKGTEPFHWGGDEKDFSQLVTDVFVGRMSGPMLQQDQIDATLGWLDAQPRRTRTPPSDTAAVARGMALFNDPAHAACGTCHVGPSLTNSQTVDVGTGGKFQVPSLVGIGTRGPFMHDGCAPTLKDRFSVSCGGGDKHGVTSNLKPTQIDDLIAYLDTL
jgi:hypothetical protein